MLRGSTRASRLSELYGGGRLRGEGHFFTQAPITECLGLASPEGTVMLRFLLLPLVVIQVFMMFGYSADGSNASNARPGWGPNGSIAETSSEDPDASPGWDPDGR